MQNRERLRECQRLERTKEIWQINRTWYPRLGPGQRRHVEKKKTNEIQTNLIGTHQHWCLNFQQNRHDDVR